MQGMRVMVWPDHDRNALRESLVGIGLQADGGETVQRRLLDSFDWRVWNAGAVLEHDTAPDASWLVWRRRATGNEPARVLGRQRSPGTPSTIADVADGPVRTLLEPALEVRALLPRAVMRLERERFRLLDDEDKTVARVALEHATLTGLGDTGDQDLGSRVVVTGVRGYDRALKRLVKQLKHETGLVAEHDDINKLAFEAAGARPGNYTTKPRVTLASELPTLRAFTNICSALLDTIEANEPGVREDIDPEFLHDFRVSIRRTRSMLSHAKGIIPDEVRERFRDEFKWIFGISSELRDLDVYLLGFDDLVAPLPAKHRDAAGPLRDLLVELRRDAHAQLVTALDSARYRELIATWQAFLAAPAAGDAAVMPVRRTASDHIWKAYRDVARHGRRIDDDTPAEAIHDLRKRAKKLRYLLEAYGSMYPEDDTAALVSELKKLQDNLGAFQDCEVQINSLRRFAELLDRRQGGAERAVEAIGRLIKRLTQRQHRAREKFHKRFVRFDRRKNQDRFRRLFKPIADPVS
jgi:CHAD domain-containing protein